MKQGVGNILIHICNSRIILTLNVRTPPVSPRMSTRDGGLAWHNLAIDYTKCDFISRHFTILVGNLLSQTVITARVANRQRYERIPAFGYFG